MQEKVKGTEAEFEIDLLALLSAFRKNIAWFIVATLIFGIGSFFYTTFFIPDRYKASATIIVNNRSDDSQYVNASQLSAAQDLAELYTIIIKSDTVLQKVIDELDLNVTYEQLQEAVTVETVNSTQVITISLTSTDPKYAEKVVGKIVEVSNPVIMDKVEAGSVKTISDAKLANEGEPVSPSVKKNTLIGAFAGFALVAVIVVLKELFNTKIKSESDLATLMGLPVLGVIPSVDRKEFRR